MRDFGTIDRANQAADPLTPMVAILLILSD